jgi:methylated-DNA-protein-cysteine methyltransferase related protein
MVLLPGDDHASGPSPGHRSVGAPRPVRSAFAEAVLAVVGTTRVGEVVTYAEVAREAGSPGAARAVGRVLREHGAGHPWWRVVTADGRLVPGLEREHAERLSVEGVATAAGRVAGFRWPG